MCVRTYEGLGGGVSEKAWPLHVVREYLVVLGRYLD